MTWAYDSINIDKTIKSYCIVDVIYIMNLSMNVSNDNEDKLFTMVLFKNIRIIW